MTGHVVLVTGGTGLIGRAICNELVAHGHRVVCVTRSESVEGSQGGVEYLRHDLFDAPAELRDRLMQRDLRPTALIHAARDAENLTVSLGGERETWNREMHLSIVAPYELVACLAELGSLRRVVMVASIYGSRPPRMRIYRSVEDAPPIWYGVAKAGTIHLARELAVRLASKGITVNSVSYGGVEGRADDELAAAYSDMTPQGRMLQLSDLGRPIEFLLDDGAEAITGQNLMVDGGWSVW